MEAAEADRKGEQDALDVDFQIASAGTRRHAYRGPGGAEVLLDAAFEESHAFKPAVAARGQLRTEFAVRGKPLELMGMLHDLIFKIDPNCSMSKYSWRLTFTGVMQTPVDDIVEDEENGEQEETKEETP